MIQPPSNQNQFINPNQFVGPNQQFLPPATGQVNGPFPLRTRDESEEAAIDSALAQFLKTMEMQFRDKQHRNGDKLDGTCEDRFFCEVAMMGRLPNTDELHRTLYNVALE